MTFKHISVEETIQLIESSKVTIIDIRDPRSYSLGHIKSAISSEDIDLETFLAKENKEKPLLVYCYHGHSSQSAAQYFVENGFENVYSLDGGFSAWPQL